ncbi:hypothetical protein ACG7TL_004215 [Trametes sanguinea]
MDVNNEPQQPPADSPHVPLTQPPRQLSPLDGGTEWDGRQMGDDWMASLSGDPAAWANRFSALADLNEVSLSGPGQPGSEVNSASASASAKQKPLSPASQMAATPTPGGRGTSGEGLGSGNGNELARGTLFTITPRANLGQEDETPSRKRPRVTSPQQTEDMTTGYRAAEMAQKDILHPPSSHALAMAAPDAQERVVDIAHSIVGLAAGQLARVIRDAMEEADKEEGLNLGDNAKRFLEVVANRLRDTESRGTRRPGEQAPIPAHASRDAPAKLPLPLQHHVQARPETVLPRRPTQLLAPPPFRNAHGGAATNLYPKTAEAAAAESLTATTHLRTWTSTRDPRIARRLELAAGRVLGPGGPPKPQVPSGLRTPGAGRPQPGAYPPMDTGRPPSERREEIKQPAPVPWSTALTRQWVTQHAGPSSAYQAESWNNPPQAQPTIPARSSTTTQQLLQQPAQAVLTAAAGQRAVELPQVYAATPADRARHTLTAEYDEWRREKNDHGTACTAEIYGRIGLDAESICGASALLSAVVATYTGVQDFKLGQPRDPPYPVNPRNLPATWFLSKLPVWAVKILVQDVRAVSTPEISVIFHEHAEEIPELLVSIIGFHQLNDGVAEAKIREILAEEVTFEGIAELAAENSAFSGANKYEVANQLVGGMYVRCRRVDEGTVGSLIVAHVYMKSPTDNPDWWMTWRSNLIEKFFRGSLYELGPDMRCDGCHGMDHTTQQCPYLRVPGWHGTSGGLQKVGSLRPGPDSPAAWARGRGDGYAANDPAMGYGQQRPKRKPTNLHKTQRGARVGMDRDRDFKGKYVQRG